VICNVLIILFLPRSFVSIFEQAATNLLCVQANSASYPQWDGKCLVTYGLWGDPDPPNSPDIRPDPNLDPVHPYTWNSANLPLKALFICGTFLRQLLMFQCGNYSLFQVTVAV